MSGAKIVLARLTGLLIMGLIGLLSVVIGVGISLGLLSVLVRFVDVHPSLLFIAFVGLCLYGGWLSVKTFEILIMLMLVALERFA